MQGMARVRPGQAPAWPLSSDRSVRRGSRVQRDFACTFARHLSPGLVVLRSQSRWTLEGRTRTLSGSSLDPGEALVACLASRADDRTALRRPTSGTIGIASRRLSAERACLSSERRGTVLLACRFSSRSAPRGPVGPERRQASASVRLLFSPALALPPATARLAASVPSVAA